MGACVVINIINFVASAKWFTITCQHTNTQTSRRRGNASRMTMAVFLSKEESLHAHNWSAQCSASPLSGEQSLARAHTHSSRGFSLSAYSSAFSCAISFAGKTEIYSHMQCNSSPLRFCLFFGLLIFRHSCDALQLFLYLNAMNLIAVSVVSVSTSSSSASFSCLLPRLFTDPIGSNVADHRLLLVVVCMHISIHLRT